MSAGLVRPSGVDNPLPFCRPHTACIAACCRFCKDQASGKAKCETGTYSRAGSAACTQAARGHYAAEDRTGELPCPTGTFNDQSGRDQCQACDEDDFCPEASIERRKCPKHSTFDAVSGMCLCHITHFAVQGVFQEMSVASAEEASVRWTGMLCHSLESVDGLQLSACAGDMVDPDFCFVATNFTVRTAYSAP